MVKNYFFMFAFFICGQVYAQDISYSSGPSSKLIKLLQKKQMSTLNLDKKKIIHVTLNWKNRESSSL